MLVPLRNSKDLGALIRDQRRTQGLSQQALADAIGVSRLWVNQVEQGKPRAEIGLVLKALQVLQVQLSAEGPDSVTDSGPSALERLRLQSRHMTRVTRRSTDSGASALERLRRLHLSADTHDDVTADPDIDAIIERARRWP